MKHNKPSLSKGIEQSVLSYPERAITLSIRHKMGYLKFEPIWEHEDVSTMKLFRSVISELPIFKENPQGQIRLFIPPPFPHVGYKEGDVEILIGGLSGELTRFFREKIFDRKGGKEFVNEKFSYVKQISDLKTELVRFGICKEKVFDKAFSKILVWSEKLLKNYIGVAVKRGQKGELEAALYPYFRNLTKLSDDAIFACIAYILSGLGTEEGGKKQISERISKRLQRKGKTLDLDVENLQKTLSYLKA